jgi:hypothetical protein
MIIMYCIVALVFMAQAIAFLRWPRAAKASVDRFDKWLGGFPNLSGLTISCYRIAGWGSCLVSLTAVIMAILTLCGAQTD